MTTPTASAYKSAKARERALASYESSLARWPLPYESLTLTTTFGETWVKKNLAMRLTI